MYEQLTVWECSSFGNISQARYKECITFGKFFINFLEFLFTERKKKKIRKHFTLVCFGSNHSISLTGHLEIKMSKERSVFPGKKNQKTLHSGLFWFKSQVHLSLGIWK